MELEDVNRIHMVRCTFNDDTSVGVVGKLYVTKLNKHLPHCTGVKVDKSVLVRVATVLIIVDLLAEKEGSIWCTIKDVQGVKQIRENPAVRHTSGTEGETHV